MNTTLSNLAPIACFTVFKFQGNVMQLSQFLLLQYMIDVLKGQIGYSQFLFGEYFRLRESFERMWEFYCAPESQKGLKKRINDTQSDTAVSIKGTFTWGVTPKFDKAEKEAIREKIKKKEYDKRTKDMNWLRKKIYDSVPETNKKYEIPLKDRTLDKIINLNDLDVNIKKGSFTIIVGEIGSGKSSLLSAMFGEMIHLTPDEISLIGDKQRPIKQQEMKGLEASLFAKDLTDNSPIILNGSTSLCEQKVWI